MVEAKKTAAAAKAEDAKADAKSDEVKTADENKLEAQKVEPIPAAGNDPDTVLRNQKHQDALEVNKE